MDTKDQIPPDLPLLKGGIPLFGKEGLGEIFGRICLFNYGLLSNFADVEMAITKGRIRRKFKRDPRGTRYEVVGPTTNGREIGIICRIKSTEKLLFITTYASEEVE